MDTCQRTGNALTIQRLERAERGESNTNWCSKIYQATTYKALEKMFNGRANPIVVEQTQKKTQSPSPSHEGKSTCQLADLCRFDPRTAMLFSSRPHWPPLLEEAALPRLGPLPPVPTTPPLLSPAPHKLWTRPMSRKTRQSHRACLALHYRLEKKGTLPHKQRYWRTCRPMCMTHAPINSRTSNTDMAQSSFPCIMESL